MMALTPELSRALAELASGLELTPQLRQDLIERVPKGAKTEADLPEDLRFLLGQVRDERARNQPQAAASASRTLSLAGRRITFSTTVLDPPRIEACGPDMPHLDPDDDGERHMAAALPSRWRGQLVPYNEAAPDGRIIKAPADGVIKSREMPLPLTAQIATADGHDNSVLIGVVDRIWSQDGALWGEGQFDLGTPEGRDWAGRIARGMAGWGSVDLDAETAPRVENQGRDRVPKRTYHDWSFAGFTLVSRPAFDSARITVWDDEPEVIEDIEEEDDEPIPREVEKLLADIDENFDIKPVEASAGGCGCGGASEDDTVQTFPAGGKTTLPLGPPTDWDSTAADKRVRAWAGVDTKEPTPAAWEKYGQAHFWHAPQPSGFGDFKLPFADVVDGQLRAMPRGVYAAAAAMEGSRGGVDIPESDVAGVRSKIGAYYKKLKRKAPWDTKSMTASLASGELVYTDDGIHGVVTGFDDETGWLRISCGRDASLLVSAEDVRGIGDSLTASAGGPVAPPDEWFEDPQLPGPTALQIDDDGRIFGHLASWQTCHMAFEDRCVKPPRSFADYGYFHVGETVTSSGKRIPVGKIVIGPGHAAPFAGWRAATSHYDRGGATVAVVRAGEDAHGIWIAGALVPEISPSQVASLRRSPLSGDWRRVGGSLELVAALAVSVPGFPIPRPRSAMVYKQQTSLVAAGVLDREHLALTASLGDIVTTAVDNALTTYAERRQRAAAALARIQASSGCSGECTCADDELEDAELEDEQ